MTYMRTLNFLFIFFLSMHCMHLPLCAMEHEEQDFRSPPPSLKRVAFESLKQAACGGICLYVQSLIDSSYENTPTSYMKIGIKQGSYIYGAHSLSSAFSNLVNGFYENMRCYFIDYEGKKLEAALKGAQGRSLSQKDRNIIRSRKKYLETMNPHKEFILYKNYLKYGIDITQATFIGYQIFNLIHESQPIHYSILPVLFCTVDINNKTALAKCEKEAFVSFVEMAATFLTAGWTTYDLWQHWKGKQATQNTPLRSFLRALSGLMSSKLFGNLLSEHIDSLPSKVGNKALAELEKDADRALVDPLYKKKFQLKIGQMPFEEILIKYSKKELERQLFYNNIFRYSFRFMIRLEFANGALSFFEGCKKLYDERNYWFSLVDDLAEEKFPPLPIIKDQKPTKTFLSHQQESKKAFVNKSAKNSQEINLDHRFEQKERTSNESITPQSLKKKTRGEPNKHISLLGQQSVTPKQPSSPIAEVKDKKDEEREQNRRNALEKIQKIRDDNSFQKHKVNSFFEKAKRFVEGEAKTNGNKTTIHWLRGTKSRSATFEIAHKQRNEKASILKGHKLTMFLDAMEQIYLDGWDKESILAHLNGRFKLYNFSYECLKVLWTHQGEEEGIWRKQEQK